MNSLTVLNFLVVLDLYVYIREDGKFKAESRTLHDRSQGQIFQGVENLVLPFITQVHRFDPTESHIQYSDEDTLPRTTRRKKKKNKKESALRKRLNYRRKKKPMKFTKTYIEDYSNQSGSVERKVKSPFDIVVHIKMNE